MSASIVQDVLALFVSTLPIIAPVFICVLTGFCWKKLGRPYDIQMVSQLVMSVGAPALIISVLSTAPISQSQLWNMLLIGSVLVGSLLLISAMLLKLLGFPIRDFIVSMAFPNVGNMGLPLCLLAFGDKGLSLALALFMVFSLLHFSVGVAILSGTSMIQQTLRNPIIYSVLAAGVMIVGDFRLPNWAATSVQLLGDFTIPLMLFTLGVSLATLRIENLAKSVILALLRLGIGVSVGWGVAEYFSLTGALRGVVILQAAMPVAVFNYMFAVQYSRQPQTVASMVLISTVVSFLTLPWLLQWLVDI